MLGFGWGRIPSKLPLIHPTRPTNITDICSFFGLVEQVSFAFSKTAVMAPFRELLSLKSEFAWTADLQVAFEEAKKVIVE